MSNSQSQASKQALKIFLDKWKKSNKSVLSTSEDLSLPYVEISNSDLKAAWQLCVEDADLSFDFLENLTAIDAGQDFVLVYQMYSTSLGHLFNLKCKIPKHAAKAPSAQEYWLASLNFEKEAQEMFGIEFQGIEFSGGFLLPEGWQGHPLRKDYVYPEEFKGIEHRREPLRKEHTRP